MRPPLVSAVIPTYNRAQMVLEAVMSVLNQTGAIRDGTVGWAPGTATGESLDVAKPSGPTSVSSTDEIEPPAFELEVIVVDDGSADDTMARLEAVRAIDSRFRILRLDRHSGFPGSVRNRGVQVACGEWIAFLDSDDYWLQTKLAEQLEFHRRHPELRISHTRERWQRGTKTVSQKTQRHRRWGDLFPDSLRKCVIGPSTVMIRRDLWEETKGFREDLEVAEDYEYWLRITSREPVGYVSSPLTVKRAGHGDQLSERYGEIEWFRIQALRPLVDAEALAEPPGVRIRPLEVPPGAWSRPLDAAGTPDWLCRDVPAHRLARLELARKLRVYAAGAAKRGRTKEAQDLRSAAKAYDF